MKRVEKKTIMIYCLEDLQKVLIYSLIIGIGFYFFGEYPLIKKGLIVATGFVVLYLIKELIYNFLSYYHTYYEVTDDAVYLKEGGFSIWKTTIPIHRIQHLDVSQSLYARLYNLYSLNLYTAGDDHSIHYIKKEIIDSLQQQILEKLKAGKEKE